MSSCTWQAPCRNKKLHEKRKNAQGPAFAGPWARFAQLCNISDLVILGLDGAFQRIILHRGIQGDDGGTGLVADRVCLEHDLSVIANPKLHSKGRYGMKCRP